MEIFFIAAHNRLIVFVNQENGRDAEYLFRHLRQQLNRVRPERNWRFGISQRINHIVEIHSFVGGSIQFSPQELFIPQEFFAIMSSDEFKIG